MDLPYLPISRALLRTRHRLPLLTTPAGPLTIPRVSVAAFITAAAMFGVALSITPIEAMPIVSDDIRRNAALG